MKLKNPEYYAGHFLPARDSYLEVKSMELLATLLPRSRIYRNLYYPVSAADKEQWVETDGIVLFDTALLVVETKAEKLSASARRGSILRLRDDLDDIIGEAHSQGVRTLSYLRTSDEVVFYDKRHEPVLHLRSNEYSDLFAIAVSYEPLGFLSAQLDSLEKLGVVKGREWPWAVYLNDLRAMSEIIEHPTHFIHYLKHRIPLNDIESFKAADELDILMLYLKEGFWIDNPELADNTAVSLVGYSEALDSYYLYREGLNSECPKPRQQMPESFERLIRALESGQPPGFVAASLVLLDCSEEARSSIAEQVERTEAAFAGDHTPHTARFMLSDGKSAILLACLDHDRTGEIDTWVDEYVNQSGLKYVTLISWIWPLQSADIRVRNHRVP